MKNLLVILSALLLVSLLSVCCSYGHEEIDAADQLTNTSWMLVSTTRSACLVGSMNIINEECDQECGIATFTDSIYTVITGPLSTFPHTFVKVDANTIDICGTECIRTLIELNRGELKMTNITIGSDECITTTMWVKQ